MRKVIFNLFLIAIIVLIVESITKHTNFFQKASNFSTLPMSEAYSIDNLTAGGTNYAVYDLGDYGNDPSDENFSKLDTASGGIKYVIGSYDLNPALVTSQLKEMCKNGQRKIGLILWFGPFGINSTNPDSVYKALVNSRGGKLQDRQVQNLKSLLPLIANLSTSDNKLCFNEMQFRFAPQGNASAIGWSGWNETQYIENRNFIFSTHDLVKNILSGSSIKLFFDIGAEEGGRTDGQLSTYLSKIWKDYTDKYGVSDTYGFSIAYAPGRLQGLINLFKNSGKMPSQFALDLYDMDGGGLGATYMDILGILKKNSIPSYPIIVQETWFADSQAFTQTVNARYTGLKVRTVMQWQVERNKILLPNGKQRSYSTVAPTFIYGSMPIMESLGLGCADKKCIWVKGKNFSDNCAFTIFTNDWKQIAVLKPSTNQVYCTDTYATMRIPDDIYSVNANLRVALNNMNSAGAWTNPQFIQIK